MNRFTESIVEEAALTWFDSIGYHILEGPVIAPGEESAERSDFERAILDSRLSAALMRLNPNIPMDNLSEAHRRVLRVSAPSLEQANRSFHHLLTEGVSVEHRKEDGIASDSVRLMDFENPENNDWLVVNQFTIEGLTSRRPDIVIFINGLPIAVIELKNTVDENATIWTAFDQLQTYKQEIPELFNYNELLVISDGPEARVGSLTADSDWFLPWRTIEGDELAPANITQLEVLIKGLFDKKRLIRMLRHFVVFEDDKGEIAKKVAGYHQFHAVENAVDATVSASKEGGNRQGGVVWHTQGSGKSLTMAFYAGRIILEKPMANPTLVVLTDRNDLDDQLFGVFSKCHDLLRQSPIQAENRAHLRELLNRASGGVIFTTIQKFFPEETADRHPSLSERRNIVVIADEAHRSQYDFIDGYARYMRDALPKATFIGFTGTPIELRDKNTRAVFGDYISIYDVQQAVEDKATVPIYYESRLAKLDLDEAERPKIDPDFEEITETEELSEKEKLKTKWAALEKLVGTDKRLELIAADLVDHFEKRLEVLNGKGMIVCMSRRICVDLYNEIIKLKPEWHEKDDKKGALKVIMTGSAPDPPEWQRHIRNKQGRENLAKRFKDPRDSFNLVIVRDMWLTGFDVPSLHTMYVDKPMRGHTLMQAIARVNRVFGDKPGGLVVDYIGFARDLKEALATYASSGGKGEAAVDQNDAVAVMKEKYEICYDLFHGFDWSIWTKGSATEQLTLLAAAQEHVLAQKDGKGHLLKIVSELSLAFALSVPHDDAIAIRDDVGFFQAVRAALAKSGAKPPKEGMERELAIKQLISRAIASEGVIDVFAAAGLKKPDISILSDEFLAEVKDMPQKNLAVELLQKLLHEEIKTRSRRNKIEGRSFAEMLERTVRSYQNRAIETAQVIEELIGLAKQIREADTRGEDLGLSNEELAFYDALAESEAAVDVLGDEKLRKIAQELVVKVRKNATIDWTVRESVRAKMRVMIKRILRQHGYPKDKQEEAAVIVLEQAELFTDTWAA